MTEILGRIVPTCLTNPEAQAFIAAGLCFVGSWVVITKIIQFVFTMIWPFLLLGAFLTLAPNWTNKFVSEIIPEYVCILQEHFKKLLEYVMSKRIKGET